MRIFILLVSLIYTINLADADQQGLLRVQWQQLSQLQGSLTDQQKLSRVQSLTSIINVGRTNATNISRDLNDVFQSGLANDAELAYSKWSMLVALGLDANAFRLAYVNVLGSNDVVLMYQEQSQSFILSRETMASKSDFTAMLANSNGQVVAVIDPTKMHQTRTRSRVNQGHVNPVSYL
jgi:hypothetical protein